MRRREFLKGAAGLAGMTLLPGAALAAARAGGDEVAAAFAKALAEKPWLLGYATASQEEFSAEAQLVYGKVPGSLRGTLFRNGPARHEVFGRRYHHWFDGDGLVQAFRLEESGVHHEARFVETSKLRREREAGRPLVSGFGTTWSDIPDARDAAEGNPANISVLHHADRLLALWEAADAYQVDAATLETRGIHTWSPETKGLPFSAHPRVEPDGTLWNFGSAPWMNALVLYQIGPDGQLRRAVPLKVEQPSYVHDFLVTERHLVFVLPPLYFDAALGGETFLSQHRWDGDAPTRILVVDKNDLATQRVFEAPASFVFHFANAWEEPGTLHVDACLYPDASIMFGEQSQVMWGRWEGGSPAPEAVSLAVDLESGRVRSEPRGLAAEFPCIDRRRTGRRHRYVVSLAQLPGEPAAHPLLNAVARQDVETGLAQTWRYPASLIPEEHLFVPAGGDAPEGEGHVLGTALDVRSGATELWIFSAARLEDGPLATLRLPYALPLGLHGCFVPG